MYDLTKMKKTLTEAGYDQKNIDWYINDLIGLLPEGDSIIQAFLDELDADRLRVFFLTIDLVLNVYKVPKEVSTDITKK